jgi:hypothetical protein
MVLPLGEFAAPLVPALPLLFELLCLIICLGIIYALKYVVKAFFGIAGGVLVKVPIVGGWFNSKITAVGDKMTKYLADGVTAVEGAVGASWHQLGRLVDWVGHELRSHASLLYTMATVMLGPEWAGVIHALQRRMVKALGGLAHNAVVTIDRIIAAEERLRHGIGEDVLPRIRTLERKFDRVLGRDLSRIREREAALEHGAGKTWDWIRHHPQTVASGAFAGAVAWALGRLGATWVRCPNASKFFNKRGCGAWDDIDGLLGLVVAAVAVANLRELVEAAQHIEEGATDLIKDSLGV